ncbi:MAG: hypothetical protein ABF290_02625 [Thiogranum sp.]|jgi:hypothetical protein
MTNFVDQLRLAERAKEDVYFARIDRELIEALHQHERIDQLAHAGNTQPDTTPEQDIDTEAGQEADK